MEKWIIALASLFAVAVAVLLFRKKPATPSGDPRVARRRGASGKPSWEQQSLGLDPQTRFLEPRERKQYRLLNESEQVLYGRLLEAMPNMIVFCQVGLSQLAQLRGRQAMEQLRSMSGSGVDFVICRDDFSIVAGIELTWPRPVQAGTPQSEEIKRKALESLGVPLIVFRPNELPDADTISREIASAIVRRNRLETEREQSLGA